MEMSLLGKWFGFDRTEVYEEAVRAYDRGDYEQAIEAFEAYLEDGTDPAVCRLARFHVAESYAQIGARRYREGDFAGAASNFEAALRLNPDYPDLNLQAARAFRGLGSREKQRHYLERALTANPRFVDAILFEGVFLYEQGEHDAGLQRVEEACRLDPQLMTERLASARRYHDEADHERAKKNLVALSSMAGNGDGALHMRLAESFVRSRMIEEALEEFRKAIAASPEYPDFRCRYGRALLELRRHEEAIEQLQKAIELNPEYAEAHTVLGEALEQSNLPVEACEAYRSALRLDPDAEGARAGFTRLACILSHG
jgi:tetratricopeptide (TPR) repeat protein